MFLSSASKHDKVNLLDAGDRCTDHNIIGVPYGLYSNICQDKSMGDIGTLIIEDCGHSRMIMPVMPQHMILTDNSYKESKSWIKLRMI